MMKCLKCKKPATQQYVDKHLCNSCYTALIEKRVRKHIRLESKIKKNTTILALDEVSKYFLDRIISMPVKIIKRNSSSFSVKKMDENLFSSSKIKEFIKEKKINTVVIPWTLDDEAEGFLEQVMISNKSKKTPDKFLKLFKTISRKDIKQFCKIRKVNFKSQKETQISKLLDTMEKKYPGTKNSVLKSSEQIRKALSKK